MVPVVLILMGEHIGYVLKEWTEYHGASLCQLFSVNPAAILKISSNTDLQVTAFSFFFFFSCLLNALGQAVNITFQIRPHDFTHDP